MQGVYNIKYSKILLRKKIENYYFVIKYECINEYVIFKNNASPIHIRYDNMKNCYFAYYSELSNRELLEYIKNDGFNTIDECVANCTQGLQPIIIHTLEKSLEKKEKLMEKLKTVFRKQ